MCNVGNHILALVIVQLYLPDHEAEVFARRANQNLLLAAARNQSTTNKVQRKAKQLFQLSKLCETLSQGKKTCEE